MAAITTWDQSVEPEVFRWNRSDYHEFLDSGVISDPGRFELIDGFLFKRPVENPIHATTCGLVQDAISSVIEGNYHVRVQHPLALDDQSEPEPDVCVVEGDRRLYLTGHPTTAMLVIEVSDSSLHIDRGRKLKAYARNGIPEYWIVNLIDRQVEVFRDPFPESQSYLRKSLLTSGESIHLSGWSTAEVPVDRLLP